MTAGGTGGGGNTIFLLIFVLVGLKEACMSNFSFFGSFSGTIPGDRAGGRVLDIAKIQLTQSSLVELEFGLSLATLKTKRCKICLLL